MADALSGVDLGELHLAMANALQTAFATELKLVAFYREEDERHALKINELPALLMELTELAPDLDGNAGGEQLPVIARFELRVVVDAMHDKDSINNSAKVRVRALAAKIAHFIFKNRHFHGLKTGHAVLEDIVEDAFYPELDRYEVWRIDISVPVNIGESVWANDGVTPTAAYSWSPQIGTGNESHYQEIDDVRGLP
ncbi:hypothetical protein SAMN05421749_103315 [Acinetobacter marinus]|uniref:Uncharacterized protein n=1 Tax=Acinetobacter marinus TaxID=281375 RepID=A0A1G6JCN4_9GAMM|nr:hypothetical protein [Acinetobacter marinus]SDC16574.1 hypothetical protein SAMN05421749_103315 [Acinetobacter marinus]